MNHARTEVFYATPPIHSTRLRRQKVRVNSPVLAKGADVQTSDVIGTIFMHNRARNQLSREGEF